MKSIFLLKISNSIEQFIALSIEEIRTIAHKLRDKQFSDAVQLMQSTAAENAHIIEQQDKVSKMVMGILDTAAELQQRVAGLQMLSESTSKSHSTVTNIDGTSDAIRQQREKILGNVFTKQLVIKIHRSLDKNKFYIHVMACHPKLRSDHLSWVE